VRADDRVVVNVDGQPRAVGEDAGLLEVADGRILDAVSDNDGRIL